MGLLGGERGEYLGYVGSDKAFRADLGTSQTCVIFFLISSMCGNIKV